MAESSKDQAYPSGELEPTQKLAPTKTAGGESHSILFKAKLRNAFDELLTGLTFAIQLYNSKTQTWTELLGGLTPEQGQINAEFVYKAENIGLSTQGELVNYVIESGGFPIVRLVTSKSQNTEWTAVLAFGGLLAPNKETPNQLILDFGDLWMLNAKNINQHLDGSQPAYEYCIAGVPRPRGNHGLHPALLAAVSQPESFAEFKVGEHDIVVQGKGQTESTKAVANPQSAEGSVDNSLELANSQLRLQQSQIEQLTQELALKNELLAAKDQEKQKVEVELTQSKESVAQLNETVQASFSRAAPINQVYSQIIEEVNSVSKASIEDENNAYTLGNVKLNLKTFVRQDDDGIKLQLVDAGKAEGVDGGTVSDLTIDIVGQEPNSSGQTTSTVSPKVIGLTETAARKRLAQFGLKLNAIYQATKNQVVGQAFKQNPAPGDDLDVGEKITVIFAKDETQFS